MIAARLGSVLLAEPSFRLSNGTMQPVVLVSVRGQPNVAGKKEDGKKKGPKGGVKHTPGRGHTRKSGPQKKKRFQNEAAKKRRAQQEKLRKQWEEWDALSPEQQKHLSKLKPKQPR